MGFGIVNVPGGGSEEKLTAHLADKNNPHGVTAEQVGARPNTWMPKLADVAFLGNSPIKATADDTTANWSNLGSGYAWYETGECLNNQPSVYGILVNYSYGSDIFQLWKAQTNDSVYVRSGNAGGWHMAWARLVTNSELGAQTVKSAYRILEDYQTYDLNALTEGFRVYKCNGSSSNLPVSGAYGHLMVMQASNESAYAVQVYFCEGDNEGIWKRYQAGGSWQAWVRVIDTKNIGGQSVNYATYAAIGNYDQDYGARLRNQALVASDTTPGANGQINWTYG